jgi:hypothetical protein
MHFACPHFREISRDASQSSAGRLGRGRVYGVFPFDGDGGSDQPEQSVSLFQYHGNQQCVASVGADASAGARAIALAPHTFGRLASISTSIMIASWVVARSVLATNELRGVGGHTPADCGSRNALRLI